MTTTQRSRLICMACNQPYDSPTRATSTYHLCSQCMVTEWSKDALREADRIESARRHVQPGAPQTLSLHEWLAVIATFRGRCALCEIVPYSALVLYRDDQGLTATNCFPACKACAHHFKSGFGNAVDRLATHMTHQ